MFDKAFGNKNFATKERRDSLKKSATPERIYADPSTSTVVGMHVRNVFTGAGSLVHMLKGRASNISEEADNKKITQAEYMQSSYYREAIPYDPSMTETSSKIKADNFDRRQRSDLIISNASGGQNVLGMASSIVAGFVEPANIAATIIASPLALVSRFNRYQKLYKRSKTKARLVKGAVEGAVGQTILEPFARAAADELEEDYTMAQSLANIGASSFFGGALNAGIGKLVDWRQGKGLTPKIHKENIDTGVKDLIEGRDVDVTSKTPEDLKRKFDPETNGEIGDFALAKNTEDLSFKTDDEHLALEAEQQANQELELLRNEDPDLLEDVNIKQAQEVVTDLDTYSKTHDGISNCILG